MNKLLLFVVIICTMASCNIFSGKKVPAGPQDKQKMIEADQAFSALSVQKGMKHAFLEYIDSNGVLLKPNRYPIIGADAIDYLIQMDDSSYTLEWQPKFGAVAASGDLGYTFGLYALKPKGKDTTIYGNYISIWKKESDGSWKFVLDSGNEGLSEEVE